MAPSYPNRRIDSSGRMRLHTSYEPEGAMGSRSEFAQEDNAFVIGNNAFFLTVKRTLDLAGGFHIVGAFTMDGLATKLRRSTLLGQTPKVAVIHEPPGHRAEADEAAHSVLQAYPGCGIVLISGDELEAETERKMEVHDYKAIVLPESAVKNRRALADGMHAAVAEASVAQRRSA